MSIEATEVERIAKQLSAAQKRSLTNAKDRHGSHPDSVFFALKATGGWRTTNILWTHGLTNEDEKLTDLGLAVRSHLMKGQDHD